MAGQSQQKLGAVSLTDPEIEGYPGKRRTLHRALAVAVAIAAISPLFATPPDGCAPGRAPHGLRQQARSSQTPEHPHP